MPAISPQRLQAQADQLAQTFDRPVVLLTRLHDLLARYADHTRRPAGSARPAPILPAYHAPAPVLRALLAAWRPLAAAHPPQALQLSDALWDDAWLETRLLAVRLLGALPPTQHAAVLERARRWAAEENDPLILNALVEEGLQGLRRQAPAQLLPLIAAWLNGPEHALREAGLQLSTALLREPGFENLPPLARLLRPLLEQPPLPLRPALEALFRAWIARWPAEAAHLLHAMRRGTPAARALARRLLPLLPAHLR